MSNISPSYKVPGLCSSPWALARARSVLWNAPRKVIACDYGTTTGTVAVNTPTIIFNADDAATKFRPGSHLHLGAKAFFEEYRKGPCTACALCRGCGHGGGVHDHDRDQRRIDRGLLRGRERPALGRGAGRFRCHAHDPGHERRGPAQRPV